MKLEPENRCQGWRPIEYVKKGVVCKQLNELDVEHNDMICSELTILDNYQCLLLYTQISKTFLKH